MLWDIFFINLDAEYILCSVAYHKQVILSLGIQNSDLIAVLETKILTVLAIQATDPQNALGWSGVIFTRLERCLEKKTQGFTRSFFPIS